MKLNKREKISFLLGLFINLIIVFIIPGYKIDDVKDKKLKVGLVALEKEKTSSKEKKKTVPAKKENIKKDAEKKAPETPAVKKEEIRKEKSLSLEAVSKTIKAPTIDVIRTSSMKKNKSNDLLADAVTAPKKTMKFEREDRMGIRMDEPEFNDVLSIDKEKRDIESDSITIETDEEISLESIKVEEGKVEGLPSGYKLGVDDGDIIARWDSANEEPKYPESAQLRGLQGSVRVKLDVNEKGEVTNLIIDKGSGVPEINAAIESIGRTWKIYLSKHGLSIKGRVILDYTFKLKGS